MLHVTVDTAVDQLVLGVAVGKKPGDFLFERMCISAHVSQAKGYDLLFVVGEFIHKK